MNKKYRVGVKILSHFHSDKEVYFLPEWVIVKNVIVSGKFKGVTEHLHRAPALVIHAAIDEYIFVIISIYIHI